MDILIRTLKASTSPSETHVIDSPVWIELSDSETKWVGLCVNLQDFSLLVWGPARRSENLPHFGFTAAVMIYTTKKHHRGVFIQRHSVRHTSSQIWCTSYSIMVQDGFVHCYVSNHQKPFWTPEHTVAYKHGLQFPLLLSTDVFTLRRLFN